jgi:four helix bundle protein
MEAMSFAAYDVSLELVRELAPIVPVVEDHDRDLAEQMRRAATSVVLGISQGRARSGNGQRRAFEIAAVSASRLLAAIDASLAWGWIAEADHARALLDRVLAMLWRLTH